MSSVGVQVEEVISVLPHNNSDNLELAIILGWQSVVQKNTIKPGDRVLYLPPDTMMREEIADLLNIKKYLKFSSHYDMYRVSGIRLRGEPSFGAIISLNTIPENFIIQENLDKIFSKYQPPEIYKDTSGTIVKQWRNFPIYTDIENIRNFPDILMENEQVVITEKIHGMCTRIGYIKNPETSIHEFVCGSHKLQRSLDSIWGTPLKEEKYKNLLKQLSNSNSEDIIVYGELFGRGIQDMDYGFLTKPEFRVFDISKNGVYLDKVVLPSLLISFDIPMVPILTITEWNNNLIQEFSDGETTVNEKDKIQSSFKGREGIVITPLFERSYPKIGRVIFKSVSVDYLQRKEK